MIDLANGGISRGRKESLACGFMGLLIALAYAELMPPIRDALRVEGLTFATTALFWIFFLTGFRVFVGNTLYLNDPIVIGLGKWLWTYDFLVIVAETVTLIFLAGVCSVRASRETSVDFIALLVTLYVVDVLWVSSQKPLRVLSMVFERRRMRRAGRSAAVDARTQTGRIPWGWALQNSLLLIGILAPRWIWPDWDFYSDKALAWLALIHVVAFYFSVVQYDFHRLLDDPKRS